MRQNFFRVVAVVAPMVILVWAVLAWPEARGLRQTEPDLAQVALDPHPEMSAESKPDPRPIELADAASVPQPTPSPDDVRDPDVPKPPTVSPPLAIAPFSTQRALEHQEAWANHLAAPVEVTNSIGMKLRLIPPGEFLMGSPPDEEGRDDDEQQHPVRITRPYYLGVYEVTQGEYQRVMGTNPSYFSSVAGEDTSRFPVEQVSWDDAVEFCRKLSALSGEQSASRVYRLPMEAEWEYACRAGTTTPFHFGSELNGQQANCDGNYPYGMTNKGPYLDRPTSVGSYGSNGFGLCDMHGNVYAWCADRFGVYPSELAVDPEGPTTGSDRVMRGGSWVSAARGCRAALRDWYSPGDRLDTLGFRVAFSSVDKPGQ